MKRMALVVLCFLLPLPLAGLLLVGKSWPSKPQHPFDNTLPMLSLEERKSRLTYQHDCDTDADCETPLGCFILGPSRRFLCLDSTCLTDQQCEEGFSCVPLKTASGKAMVRICSLVGKRKEGEICTVLSTVQEDACERGLLCQGRCGRPCRLDEPSSCPEGFLCSEGREGPPSCLPTCKGRPCPEGLQCLPRGKRASVCARVHGEDCRKNKCPPMHLCRMLEPPQRPWDLRTECTRVCDKDSSCPAGHFCLQYQCRKPCVPESPETCGPGLTCGRHHPLDPWYCIPG